MTENSLNIEGLRTILDYLDVDIHNLLENYQIVRLEKDATTAEIRNFKVTFRQDLSMILSGEYAVIARKPEMYGGGTYWATKTIRFAKPL